MNSKFDLSKNLVIILKNTFNSHKICLHIFFLMPNFVMYFFIEWISIKRLLFRNYKYIILNSISFEKKKKKSALFREYKSTFYF